MELARLLQGLEVRQIRGGLPAGEVRGVTADSRRVEPGMVFVAVRGTHTDGHRYLAQAARAGALAAVVEEPAVLELPQVQVADSRRALAILAARFHGRPDREMTLVGVTGTNGKTTLTYLVEAVLSLRGPVGVMGTVETRFAGRRHPAALTTPDPVELAARLAEMRAAGVNQVVMEVSSHALDQRRADGLAFDLGVFTNLSRDHLDYHRDLEDYFAAKGRLFRELLPAARGEGKAGVAVVCVDGPWGRRLAGECRGRGLRVITYGLSPQAEVRGEESRLGLEGGLLRVVWPGGAGRVRTPLVGAFNLVNLLGAAAVGLGLGLDMGRVLEAVGRCGGVPGRLERVGEAAVRPAVFVDYAHTDDALRQVLAALRPLTPGRLICVFGAGGDRDPGKRPLMGRAVARGADAAVLTSDNPRSEDPLAIMAMIRPGLEEGGMRSARELTGRGVYVAEPDRARAIALAVAAAGEDDVVLIAGKGHEDYQIVGRRRRHFDDREQAAAALAARGALGEGGCRASAGC